MNEPLTIKLHGIGEASCGEIRVKAPQGKDVLNIIARRLVESGHPEKTPVTVMRGKTACFKPATLATFAKWVATEGSGHSVRFQIYTPMPDHLKVAP